MTAVLVKPNPPQLKPPPIPPTPDMLVTTLSCFELQNHLMSVKGKWIGRMPGFFLRMEGDL
ncbi:hypothetical protein GCM10020370_25560 [Paenibacillus hodogayensis]